MKKGFYLMMCVALLAGLVMAVGCAKEKVAAPGGNGLSAEEQARLKAEQERRLREARLREQQLGAARLREMFVNQDIHFDYDRYDLSAEAKQILTDKAAYLKDHPQVKVIIEGHCDERGSNAYNMALGEKRARAAAAYLEAMGIDPNRLETVSYGEEKPLVLGHSEEAYAANRRAHFVIK